MDSSVKIVLNSNVCLLKFPLSIVLCCVCDCWLDTSMFFNCVQTDTEDLFCVYLARCRSVSGSFSITPGSLCESSVCVSGGAVSLFLSASSLLSLVLRFEAGPTSTHTLLLSRTRSLILHKENLKKTHKL